MRFVMQIAIKGKLSGVSLATALGLLAVMPVQTAAETAAPRPTTASAATATASQPRHKVKAPKMPQAPSPNGLGESRAEREQRLRRECRGKPNAGACEGYAS